MFETNYSIKSGTFNMIINPDLQAIADIKQLKKDVVGTFSPEVTNDLYMEFATDENINGHLAYSGPNGFTTLHVSYDDRLQSTLIDMYLRVAFVVDPKDNSRESVIVKTFDVDIERTYEYL